MTCHMTHRHYPTTKFTSVSDTPENLRLKKQTAQQSDVSLTPPIIAPFL